MRVLIDTNIFFDMLQKRENYISAKKIISLVNDDSFNFFVADITLINIDYVARKQISNIREFLKYINDYFTVVGANNSSFTSALDIENKDLEDNLQYCLALEQGCDYIVTNNKSFLKKDIKVISSEDFVLKYLN
jgi:predicted nucleic acid-binding protein